MIHSNRRPPTKEGSGARPWRAARVETSHCSGGGCKKRSRYVSHYRPASTCPVGPSARHARTIRNRKDHRPKAGAENPLGQTGRGRAQTPASGGEPVLNQCRLRVVRSCNACSFGFCRLSPDFSKSQMYRARAGWYRTRCRRRARVPASSTASPMIPLVVWTRLTSAPVP
jgi:hypothetical protein